MKRWLPIIRPWIGIFRSACERIAGTSKAAATPGHCLGGDRAVSAPGFPGHHYRADRQGRRSVGAYGVQVFRQQAGNHSGNGQEADRRAIHDLRAQVRDFDDPVDALCHLESLLVGYSLEVLPAALWKELLPLILTGGTDLPEAYRQLNSGLQAEIAGVLRDLQSAGKLRLTWT